MSLPYKLWRSEERTSLAGLKGRAASFRALGEDLSSPPASGGHLHVPRLKLHSIMFDHYAAGTYKVFPLFLLRTKTIPWSKTSLPSASFNSICCVIYIHVHNGSVGKELVTMQKTLGDQVDPWVGDDPLQQEMAACSFFLTESRHGQEPGRLESKRVSKVGHDWTTKKHAHIVFWVPGTRMWTSQRHSPPPCPGKDHQISLDPNAW